MYYIINRIFEACDVDHCLDCRCNNSFNTSYHHHHISSEYLHVLLATYESLIDILRRVICEKILFFSRGKCLLNNHEQ